MTLSYYNYIGNFHDKSVSILSEYILPDNNPRTKCWDKRKYSDMSPDIKLLCEEACLKSNFNDLLTNPYIIVERHHNILVKDSKVKNHFGEHIDSYGPAGGPCRSMLYYYQIDPDIENSELNFYDGAAEPVCKFHPKSGDLISFDDGIYHCPGDFKTNSTVPVVRGVIAIFILIENEERKARGAAARPC